VDVPAIELDEKAMIDRLVQALGWTLNQTIEMFVREAHVEEIDIGVGITALLGVMMILLDAKVTRDTRAKAWEDVIDTIRRDILPRYARETVQ